MSITKPVAIGDRIEMHGHVPCIDPSPNGFLCTMRAGHLLGDLPHVATAARIVVEIWDDRGHDVIREYPTDRPVQHPHDFANIGATL